MTVHKRTTSFDIDFVLLKEVWFHEVITREEHINESYF